MAVVSNLDTLVTIFGGSGFLGRHIVRALARRDFRVRNAVRRPDLAGHLQPLGRVGQIHSVQANIRYPETVAAAMRDSAVVINLVGILFERGRQSFAAAHADGAAAIAQSAAAIGARVIHVSAIGADPDSPSVYARTKAAGEAAVREATPHALIFRPSVVFGPEDQLFNRFAAMARLSPVLPLVGGGGTRLQPVFVGDVAEAIARAVEGRLRPGTTYELGGPEVMTLRGVMETTLTIIERRRLLVPLPFPAAHALGRVLQILPKPPITADQVQLLRNDNVVSEAAIADGRTLEGMGIEPAAVETIVPTYLWRFRRTGQFRQTPAQVEHRDAEVPNPEGRGR